MKIQLNVELFTRRKIKYIKMVNNNQKREVKIQLKVKLFSLRKIDEKQSINIIKLFDLDGMKGIFLKLQKYR